jgi:hypothetical protein
MGRSVADTPADHGMGDLASPSPAGKRLGVHVKVLGDVLLGVQDGQIRDGHGDAPSA